MRVGFTGTQRGMTVPQQERVRTLLMGFYSPGSEFRHGDCIGADYQAANIAAEIGYRIICHPPKISTKRAYVPFDLCCVPKPYLDRNHDIVDQCEVLIAAPGEAEEVLRSGTWATVRYARKTGRRIELVLP